MAALQREARGRLGVRGKSMCARTAVWPPAAQVKKKHTTSAAGQILSSIKQLADLRVPGLLAVALPQAIFLHDPNAYLNAIRHANSATHLPIRSSMARS